LKLFRLLRLPWLCASLVLSLSVSAAERPVLRFATEDWPPFFSSTLPGNGLTGALLAAVVERMGYTMQIDYFPWKRAMEQGLHNPRYAGAVALFRTPEREKLCHFSEALGSRQTVLAYLKEKPVSAVALGDLQGVRLGTVDGYSYGEQFDAMVRDGLLAVEKASSDEVNLRKLLHQRFHAIVIEKRMLNYLLAHGRYSLAEKERIAIADNLFSERNVHVCFQRTEEGARQQQAFNKQVRSVDLAAIERNYWRGIGEALLPLAKP
jgi:polar amino acid transport system substrate-binding protein